MKHRHKWILTGRVGYTCPLQHQEKCKCGEFRWTEDKKGIPKRLLSSKELEKYKKKIS
jgi:hypothetical protein